MTSDSKLSPNESIKLVKETQRMSKLNAIPGKWYYFILSLITGFSFGLLCIQSILAIIPILLFPVIIYIQKQKAGLWSLGPAPFLGQVNSFYSFNDYWKDLRKVKPYVHAVYLIAILIMLSFPWQYINILEYRDSGVWWIPIAIGLLMGISHFTVLLISRNFQKIKYNINNNE